METQIDRKMDMECKVNFRGGTCSLKEALDTCNAGDIIEGASVHIFNKMILYVRKTRNKDWKYFTDRRYGKWRFILYGIRDPDI